MNKQKLTMVELFSGIGAQKRGFDNSGAFDCEVLATSDLDKDAIVTYASNHCGLTKELIESYASYPTREEMIKELSNKNIGYDFKKEKEYDWNKIAKKKTKELEKYWLAMHLSNNLGDITKINKLPQADLWFYSSPCTNFSISGKQEGSNWTCAECGFEYLPTDYSVEERYKCPKCGSEHIKSTTSGVLYEVERLLVESKNHGELPKYLCLENVKNLVGKKFITNFEEWVKRLEALGYNTYWKVINAKDCGIPQNRERVFAFSIRKDIDRNLFTFPQPFDLGIRLKDVLEDSVEDKYYLSEEIQQRFHITDPTFEKNIIGSTAPESRSIGQRDRVYGRNSVSPSLSATDYKQPKQILDNEINMLGLLPIKGNEQVRRVYDSEGISPTLNTMQGRNRQPKVQEGTYRIRKLTPTECFLLMGFTKEDVEKARTLGMSDSSLYKQAGNSIVTNCITLLAQHLYKAQYDSTFVCDDERILDEATTTSFDKYSNNIAMVEIPMIVKIRKNEVDIKSLQKLLRDHKKKSSLSNKDIATALNKPLTMVEHWFRTDKCFSIPEENVWYELKSILNISDTSFDKQITEFEYKEGVFEKSTRHYLDVGIAPTLTTVTANEKIIQTEQ